MENGLDSTGSECTEMETLSDFKNRLETIDLSNNEVVRFEEFCSRLNEVEDGLLVEGDGVLIQLYINDDIPHNDFPFMFYAQKCDPSKFSFANAPEAQISKWYEDLERACYCTLDPAMPVLVKQKIQEYLGFLDENALAKRRIPASRLFFKITCF